MASTAATPLAMINNSKTPRGTNNHSPFLKLAPELRNRIYEYAFTAVKTTGLVPHPLTHTNRQIRSESRAMYYASVQCLEIPLRTPKQLQRAGNWVVEVDWDLYGDIPDLVLLSYNPSLNSDVTIFCTHEETIPAEELATRLSLWSPDVYQSKPDVTDRRMFEFSLRDTFSYCLGLGEATTISQNSVVPDYFIDKIEAGDTWSVRHVEYEVAGSNKDIWDDPEVHDMFWDEACCMRGTYDWNEDVLGSIIGWLERNNRYRVPAADNLDHADEHATTPG